jgi:antibiotic biosynthesis monooxygenase (ABM) superfamily enzyme
MLRTWWSNGSPEWRRRLTIFYVVNALVLILAVILGLHLLAGAMAAYVVAQTVIWIRYPRLASRRKRT